MEGSNDARADNEGNIMNEEAVPLSLEQNDDVVLKPSDASETSLTMETWEEP